MMTPTLTSVKIRDEELIGSITLNDTTFMDRMRLLDLQTLGKVKKNLGIELNDIRKNNTNSDLINNLIVIQCRGLGLMNGIHYILNDTQTDLIIKTNCLKSETNIREKYVDSVMNNSTWLTKEIIKSAPF